MTGPVTGLVADCSRCFALCCVALPFSASADFAFDKGAGDPCRNLRADFTCGIHARLRPEGFPGCTAYDCFGAGQQTSQVVFAGQDWRSAPRTARTMFEVFPVVRQLHELRWYLAQARARIQTGPSLRELEALDGRLRSIASGPPAAVGACDTAALRSEVDVLLVGVSELVRRAAPGARADLRGADLMGRDLRRRDLRGAHLRGAYLIGADLRSVDLDGADLLGADLRGADLAGARLSGSLFLTRGQVGTADGDLTTSLPPELDRPGHWGAGRGTASSTPASRPLTAPKDR